MIQADVSSSGSPEELLRDLRSLSAPAAVSDDVNRLLSDRVLAALAAPGDHREQLVRSVCELAVDPDPCISQRGQQILFSTIAETLGDSFDDRAVGLHDAVLSSVIEFCRRLPGGSTF